LSLINNESGNRFSKSHAEMLFTVLILPGTSLNHGSNKWESRFESNPAGGIEAGLDRARPGLSGKSQHTKKSRRTNLSNVAVRG
jgi:hypothetical protein